MGSHRLAFAAASLACLLSAGSAEGGSPGRWSAIAQGAGVPTSAQDVGLARTSDGVLHVAWSQATGPRSAVIRVRSITPGGQLGVALTAVSGFGISADPTLVAASGGLRLFFAAGTPIEGLLSSTSPAGGAPWSAPALVVDQELAYARTPGVTNALDGTPLQTWYSGGDIIVHRGLSPTSGIHALTSAGTNARPNIATDASGRVWVVWCRFGSGSPVGTLARQVDPSTGAPVGAQIQLPGSSTTFGGNRNAACVLEATVARRMPVAARVGGGVYAAGSSGYPTLTRLLVWRLDTAGVTRTLVAASAKAVSHSEPALAAAPDGRVWVAWLETGGPAARIVARRSNRQGTVLGAPVRVTPPGGISTAALDLSAQPTRLDLIALVQTPRGGHFVRHTQLLPGLTLVRGAVAPRGRSSALVTFRVLDAGDPVSGADVRAGGQTAVTAANGVATLLLPRSARPRRVIAATAHGGYIGARISFRCC